jgi:hypothetical protein
MHHHVVLHPGNCLLSLINTVLLAQALKEAFEAVFDKDVAGWTSPDLFAALCADIVGRERLTDELAEDEIEKVHSLPDCLH